MFELRSETRVWRSSITQAVLTAPNFFLSGARRKTTREANHIRKREATSIFLHVTSSIDAADMRSGHEGQVSETKAGSCARPSNREMVAGVCNDPN